MLALPVLKQHTVPQTFRDPPICDARGAIDVNLMQWVWCVTVLLLGGFVWLFRRWYRRRTEPIFGPLFGYELLRLARGGQLPRLRVILVALLLAGLFITYLGGGEGLNRVELIFGGASLRQARMDKFAETFLIAFLFVQLVAVVLITPVIAGSAISEEKDRGTLDFLLSSMLSHREIILGKFAARMAAVLSVIAAGLPVLTFSTLFGSVDLQTLLGGYVIAVMTALSMGAHSVLLCLRRESLRAALLTIYTRLAFFTVGGLACGCVPGLSAMSPFSALLFLFVPIFGQAPASGYIFWINVGVYVIVHTWVAVTYLVRAIRELSGTDLVVKKVVEGHPNFEVVLSEWERHIAARTGIFPAIDDESPHVWRERYFTGRVAPNSHDLSGPLITLLGTTFVFIFGMVFFAIIVQQIEHGQWVGDAINPMMRFLLPAVTIVISLLMSTRTASCITRERERQTLDGLLLIPEARRLILIAKLSGPWIWLREVLIGMAVMVFVTLFFGGVHPMGSVSTLIQAVGFMVFATSLGLWLSLRCATVTRATVWVIGIITTTFFAPLFLAEPLSAGIEVFHGSSVGTWPAEMLKKFSSPLGIWQAFFTWKEYRTEAALPHWREVQLFGLLAGMVYLLLGWVLWRRTLKRFEQL